MALRPRTRSGGTMICTPACCATPVQRIAQRLATIAHFAVPCPAAPAQAVLRQAAPHPATGTRRGSAPNAAVAEPASARRRCCPHRYPYCRTPTVVSDVVGRNAEKPLRPMPLVLQTQLVEDSSTGISGLPSARLGLTFKPWPGTHHTANERSARASIRCRHSALSAPETARLQALLTCWLPAPLAAGSGYRRPRAGNLAAAGALAGAGGQRRSLCRADRQQPAARPP